MLQGKVNERQHSEKKPSWFLWLFLGLFAISGLAFSVQGISNPIGLPNATATPSLRTATVQRGDLSVSASGNGNLIPAQNVDLGFSNPGKISTLNVQLGDQVNAGQVLAQLDGIEQLKVNIQALQLSVDTVQQTIDNLQANANGNKAQALATQASAQAAVATAQAGVHYKGDSRCAPSLTQEYYFKYLYAQQNVDFWQGKLNNPKYGYGWQYVMQNLTPAKRKRDLAYYNYVYCQGYTDQEIQASQARLQKAQVDAQQAESNYQNIRANNGVDPNELQLAQAQLKNAQAQLAKAQADLEGMTLVAPFDGVVTAVSGVVGQPAGKSSVLSLADISHPRVQVNIDETDLQNFNTGCSARVAFAALPGKTFKGVVDWVAPSLVNVNGAPAVQGQITLNTPPSGTRMPLLGSNTTVTVTCQSAQNALQIPIIALYQPAGQPSYVYILNQQGLPEKRIVSVGIKTTGFAEILSGLNEGDRVITTPEAQLNKNGKQ
jgi:HlyD family secretion protein